MIKIVSFIILFAYFIKIANAQSDDMISNKDIVFKIIEVSESEKNGFFFKTGAIAKVNNLDFNSEEYSNKIIELIEALKSEHCDFAANVILYSLSHRNAYSLMALTIFNLNTTTNCFEYDKDVVKFWKDLYKDEEIKYWETWQKVNSKDGKMFK